MRRKLFQFAAYAAAAVVLIGCTRNTLAIKEEGIPVVITPTILETNSPSVNLAPSKAKVGNFDQGDVLGLYLVEPSVNGNSLVAANRYFAENYKMVVGSNGTMKAESSDLYYEGRDAVLDFYSYYPYDANVTGTNPENFNFTVRTNQNEDINHYYNSDLCHSSKEDVGASDADVAAGAAELQYSHQLSQLVFGLTVSKQIGNKTVKGIQSVKVVSVETRTRFNLALATLHAPDGDDYQIADISAYQVSDNSNNPNDDKTYISTFALVLPPQDIEAERNFIEIIVEFNDNSTNTYWYTTSNAIAYGQGESFTYVLSISDSESAVKLETNPTIGPWTDVTTIIDGNGNSSDGNNWGGGLGSKIENNFTVYWDKPVEGYEEANKVTITIKNPETGETTDYTVDITDMDSSDPDFGIVEFPLVDDNAPFGYPFEIVEFEFKKYDEVIDNCESLNGYLVTGNSDYTIAVVINNIIGINSGDITVDNWEDLIGTGMLDGVGVANGFRVRLLESGVLASDIKKVVMVIGGNQCSWTSSYWTEVKSNSLYTELSGLDLSSATGTKPTAYPYTITSVVLYGTNDTTLATFSCNAGVVSAGGIVLDLSK